MKKIALNLFISLILSGCVGSSSSGRVSSLFFSVEDDQKLGLQVQEEIESNPSEYPLLPESKSVVNMVHRIQNRNTGYSDFGTNGTTSQFSFSSNISNPVSHGANALKLENEIISENFNDSVNDINDQYHEELLKNQQAENIVENIAEENEVSFAKEAMEKPTPEKDNSADLKEFGVDTNEPDLFNTDNQISSTEDLIGSSNNDHEDDDLEIPAFLRRQKN